MNTTTKSNFLNNVENILSNIITNNESMLIKTENGNVVILTEEEYKQLRFDSNIVKYNRAGD